MTVARLFEKRSQRNRTAVSTCLTQSETGLDPPICGPLAHSSISYRLSLHQLRNIPSAAGESLDTSLTSEVSALRSSGHSRSYIPWDLVPSLTASSMINHVATPPCGPFIVAYKGKQS